MCRIIIWQVSLSAYASAGSLITATECYNGKDTATSRNSSIYHSRLNSATKRTFVIIFNLFSLIYQKIMLKAVMGTPKSFTLLRFKSLSGTVIPRFRKGRLLQSLNHSLLTKFYNYIQHNTHEVRIIKIKTNNDNATINSVQLPAELLSLATNGLKK